METRMVVCDKCGEFEVQGDSFEEIRDEVHLHIMLTHGATQIEERGLPNGYSST